MVVVAMASLNKVMLIGNLTRDPEIRRTPKGTPVVELGLAMNRYYTSDGGERREEATFVDVTLWGRDAENANNYLAKGRQVYVEGRLQFDTWQDKQTGQNRSKLRVVGERIQFLGQRDGGGGGQSQGGGGYQQGGGGGGYQNQGGGGGSYTQEPQGGGGGGYESSPSQDSPPPQEPSNGGGGGGPAMAPEEDDDIPF